jgi:Na+/H+ antiporter NhaB
LFQDLGTGIPGVNWASVGTVVSGLLALLTRESNIVSIGESKWMLKKIGFFVFAIGCPVFIAVLLLSISLGEGLIGLDSGQISPQHSSTRIITHGDVSKSY